MRLVLSEHDTPKPTASPGAWWARPPTVFDAKKSTFLSRLEQVPFLYFV